MPDTKEDRLAVAILTGFAIARLLFAFAIGLGVDESYTVAISRRLSLSYFDHPPLHLWMAHLAAFALGENVAVRVVFVCLFFATGWIYYQFASRLFGPRSALVALFALNVTPFFFASAGGWIVPDGPLLFGLALAAWAASRIFFPLPLEEASTWQFWPLVGLGLGLAGLSKSHRPALPLHAAPGRGSHQGNRFLKADRGRSASPAGAGSIFFGEHDRDHAFSDGGV